MNLRLSDYISEVIDELFAHLGHKKPKGSYPLMIIEGVELDVSVRASTNPDASIGLYVVTDGESENSNLNRIKIRLTSVLSADEIRKELQADPHRWNGIREGFIVAAENLKIDGEGRNEFENSALAGDPTTDAPVPSPRKQDD